MKTFSAPVAISPIRLLTMEYTYLSLSPSPPRTGLDCLMATTHIVSYIAYLTDVENEHKRYGCTVVGAINAFTLTASNAWYLVLAVDLVKAIRNPFR